jgi:hypothetical protein
LIEFLKIIGQNKLPIYFGAALVHTFQTFNILLHIKSEKKEYKNSNFYNTGKNLDNII